MAITAYTSLRPEVIGLLPDCPLVLIDQALQMGGREFCVETEAFRDYLAPVSLVADQENYTLTPTTSFEILRVVEARIRTADEVTAGDLGTVHSPAEYEFIPSELYPTAISNTLRFFSAPSSAAITSGLLVLAAMAPIEDTVNMTTQYVTFMSKWCKYVVAWALYHLFSTEGKPWSSPTSAIRYYDLFRRGVAYARRERDVLGTTRGTSMAFLGFLNR